jgi:hypothetical protein
MHLDAQAAIEKLQPYHGVEGFEVEPLWWLNELNRREKHRALQVVAAFHGWSRVLDPRRVGNLAGFVIEEGEEEHLTDHYVPISGRTKIVTWRLRLLPKDPEKPVRLNPLPMLDVAFDPDTPCVPQWPIVPVITRIVAAIDEDVIPALRDYLS